MKKYEKVNIKHTNSEGSSLLHMAIEFASVAHNDQMRKGTEIAYIVHPFEVAQILSAANCDTDVIIAGLLHDTIEDTTATIDDIQSGFGNYVAKLVSSCSEDKTKSWEDRKQHTIRYLAEETNYDILKLACADKLSNLRSIYSDFLKIGNSLWSRFNRGKDKQEWYYGNLVKSLIRLQDSAMFEELEVLFNKAF